MLDLYDSADTPRIGTLTKMGCCELALPLLLVRCTLLVALALKVVVLSGGKVTGAEVAVAGDATGTGGGLTGLMRG